MVAKMVCSFPRSADPVVFTEAYLAGKIRSGGSGVWGAVPMPPQGHVKDEELAQLVNWILQGAKAQ